MKRILYICEPTSGGVRRHIMDLLYNLDKEVFEVYLMYGSSRPDAIFLNALDRLAKMNGITLIENEYLVRSINIKNDLKAFFRIINIIKYVKPDIVHCHSSKAGVLGRIATKFLNVKKIYYTPHAYFMQNKHMSHLKRKIFTYIESILSHQFTTKTINVSEGEKNFAVKNKIDKEDKFIVIYNGIEENFNQESLFNIREIHGVNYNDVVIGTTSRMDKQKDPVTFYYIAKEVSKRHDNVKFLCIGDGILKNEIEKRIIDDNLQSKIKILGFKDDVESFLQIFDIYMSTSIYEGMSYSIIEALKAKIPIVATDVIGNNEAVLNGYNGLLFEPENILDGIDKVERLLSGEYNIKDMGENSYALYKEHFTIVEMIKNLEKIYLSDEE